MTHPDDFTIEYRRQPNGSITDFRITRGKALYSIPRWQRWLMPLRWFSHWRKPKVPFPSPNPHMPNITLLIPED
jgi:hypothetical protein